jgi:flagellar motility protein MotE (MotC chaperone)
MSSLGKTIGVVVLGLGLSTGTTLFMLAKASGVYVAKIAEAQAEAEAKKVPEKPWDFWTVEMENLATDLKEQKAMLKQKEESLSQREARLAVERNELEKTRKQLEKLRADIDSRLIEVSAGEMANLKKLAQTYGAMAPKASMPIYREMDDVTLAKLLSLMKNDTVKLIFEEMSRQSVSDPQLAKRVAILSDKLRLIKAPTPNSTPQ